jgi:hypothetical protein
LWISITAGIGPLILFLSSFGSIWSSWYWTSCTNIPNVEREATDFDIINEAEEPIYIAGFNMVPVSRLAKATQPSTEETLPPANPSDEPDIGNVVGFNIKSEIYLSNHLLDHTQILNLS